jgi:hypothetical protein
MTSDGSPVTRFRRSIEVRSVNQAEMAMREMHPVMTRPRRWLGLLLAECGSLTLDDVQLALACLRSLPAGDVEPIRDTLRALVKRRHRLRGH